MKLEWRPGSEDPGTDSRSRSCHLHQTKNIGKMNEYALIFISKLHVFDGCVRVNEGICLEIYQ